MTIKDAIDMLQKNDGLIHQNPSSVFYIENDRIRSREVRPDYEFPYLHEILRFHLAALSLLPKNWIIEPRQSTEEQFFCVVQGSFELKLLNGVFSQNIY